MRSILHYLYGALLAIPLCYFLPTDLSLRDSILLGFMLAVAGVILKSVIIWWFIPRNKW